MFVKLKKCFSDVKQLLRMCVLIICICISCYQLIGCFTKIRNPPISTHYTFELNQSLRYPAITICRSPPFKTDLFQKYGFVNNHEIQTSMTWKSFNYANYTLQEFFEETTYGEDEIILMKGFDASSENLDVYSSFTLKYGRCYTYKPKKESINFGSKYGYVFILENNENSSIYASPGFHIFIQNRNDLFTEKGHKVNAFNEYTYVEVGDNVAINLKINKFNQLSTSNSKCNPECNYTQSKCIEGNTNKFITEAVGCSTPWVPNDNLQSCNNYNQTKLIVEYSTEGDFLDNFIMKNKCGIRCNLTTYTPFLQSVRVVPKPYCAFKIYISSNLYTLMEEVIGYDWNSFLSDLGGSLGFLLGLSVLGMITMAEQVINTIIKIKNSKKKSFDLNNAGADDGENKKQDSIDNGNIVVFDKDEQFAKKISNEEKNLTKPSKPKN